MAGEPGYPVTTSEYSWEAIVASVNPDYARTDDIVYEFSNGRTFESSDVGSSGIYDGS